MTDRSTNGGDKRRVMLDAAVRVFGAKGFHTCRVGDIAEEAGIAHGPLYHRTPASRAGSSTAVSRSS